MQKSFIVSDPVSHEAVTQALGFLHESLSALKLNTKDLHRAELISEETLLRLMEYADFSKHDAFSVKVRKFFGDVFIDLTVPGQEIDFSGSFEPSHAQYYDELSPDTAEAIQNILLRSYSQYINYKHSHGYNIITIKAFLGNYSGLYKTLTALILAGLTGILLKSFAPESLRSVLNDDIFMPVRTLFMNGLKMCAVPIVFFSIASSVSDIGSFPGLKKTGFRLITWFAVMQVLAVVVGFGVVILFGTGKGAGLQSGQVISQSAAMPSFAAAITGLIPDNLMRPFFEGNMIQLIILAFLCGTAAASSKAKSIITAFNDLNRLFMKATGYFIKFMPVVIFCSIASVVITTGLNTILSVLGVLMTLLAGYAVLNIIYCFALKFYAGLSPIQLYKKSLSVIITAFTTCSSNACIPDMMKSADEMGIFPKLYSFSLPFGVSVNKTSSMFFIIAVIAAANMYGINITFTAMVSVTISAIIMNIAAPGMAGGAIIALSVLLSQAGCPMEFIALMMSIETIRNMTSSPTNCVVNLVCTALTAQKENLIDLEKYNRP